MTDLNVVEICAGAGGQSLGLHLAGFRHTLAVELDHTAASTLRHNLTRLHPGDDPDRLVAVGDAADVTVWRPEDYTGKITLLAGGVPCPPFTVAGKQLGSTDERDLFAWAVELAGRVQPEAVLLENVRGLNDARFAGYRQAVVDRLRVLGYSAYWKLLEAKDYGVPQLRPRMVLVALRPEYVDYFRWPDPASEVRTVADVLTDLMSANGWRDEHLERWTQAADKIAPTIVGGSKRHGGADLGPTRAKRAWAELWTDGHGLANAAPDENWQPAKPGRGPRLTVDMVARLQGWYGKDYAWHFLGLKTSRYRQIGNAFPPPVARAVGQSLGAALRKQERAPAGHAELLTVVHDEVFRALSETEGWLTASRLSTLLSGQLPADAVARRIDHIGRDFVVEAKTHRGEMAWKLGEWRAFRGQDDHQRHLAFAAAGSRGKIS